MVLADHTYRIGEVAARSGLTPDTLRFYERLGLLSKPSRTRGGFRLYAAETFDRLQFIKRAQVLGFTLDEVRELVGFNGQGSLRRCRRVHDLLKGKVDELDVKVTELNALQGTLKHVLRQCERALESQDPTVCPVIELRPKQ